MQNKAEVVFLIFKLFNCNHSKLQIFVINI